VSESRFLSGRRALVTGAATGIGRATAKRLAEAGAAVVVNHIAGDPAGEALAEIRDAGGHAVAIEADVSRENQVAALFEQAASEFGGPIDLLVNNAGIEAARGLLWEQPVADWWHVFEVNVLGAVLCCRSALPGMVERRSGRIVNVGSGGSYLPVRAGSTTLGTAYGPSKAALGRFSELLAAQVWDYGVRVFLISPGLVRTSMTEPTFGDDAPWTPPELAPRLVRALASGRADALAGRYLHAEHDDVEELIRRADEVVDRDLNAIRLQR
jgi:NAD(P)-dependent dehydrogenase (short-subunit alcohol dehydrogenase family)